MTGVVATNPPRVAGKPRKGLDIRGAGFLMSSAVKYGLSALSKNFLASASVILLTFSWSCHIAFTNS
jgi:hypothetical protein